MYRFIEISSYNIRRHALPARQSVSFRRMVKNRIADYRTFSPMVSSQILIVSFNNVIANSLHNLFDNRLYKKSTVIPSKLRWICVVWWSRGESNPCPKTSPYRLLRVQPVFLNSLAAPPSGRLRSLVAPNTIQPYEALRRIVHHSSTLCPRPWYSAAERRLN